MQNKTMQAAVYTRYGPPEVVEIKQIPIPNFKKNEVLIRVHASTVNRTDCGFRSAEYFISRFFSGLFRPSQQVLGSEFAGEIVSVGEQVVMYKPGDRIFGFNDSRFGAHAEWMVLPETSAMSQIPNGMTYLEAAALTEGSHYALCDIRAARIEPGQAVLVNGGTGAIGSAAVQLLKYFGAHVTAVCAGEHVELLLKLGADKVIDYTKEDFTSLKNRFWFVFDAVGKSSFGRCKALLEPGGIYISTELGRNAENIFLAMLPASKNKARVKFPLPTINRDDVRFICELADKGVFRPLIDRTYPLQDIVEAYRYVETGMKVGNVLLKTS
jgi:NADPH:quinone reductase-like Zn-dependent oxidoreductase